MFLTLSTSLGTPLPFFSRVFVFEIGYRGGLNSNVSEEQVDRTPACKPGPTPGNEGVIGLVARSEARLTKIPWNEKTDFVKAKQNMYLDYSHPLNWTLPETWQPELTSKVWVPLDQPSKKKGRSFLIGVTILVLMLQTLHSPFKRLWYSVDSHQAPCEPKPGIIFIGLLLVVFLEDGFRILCFFLLNFTLSDSPQLSNPSSFVWVLTFLPLPNANIPFAGFT